MAGEKVQVIWSPNNESEFATYGSELRVYKYVPLPEGQKISSSDIQLSSKSIGKLISVNTEVSCLPIYQTVAWQPSKDHSHCFAVGQSNGKVSLINLLPGQPLINSHGFQLSPKTLGRPCNCIAWNYNDNRLLAEGLEKTRSDSSLIVWDINQATGFTNEKTKTTFSKHSESSSSDDRSKFFETGHGENTSSIAWLQENTLIAGMGSRYLKVFDIREYNVALQTSSSRECAQHKGIFGISVDPSFNYQLASYAEGNNVYMWDIRMFQKPLYSFTRPGNIQHVSWLTTRPGCLSVVSSEAPYLRLINIPYLLNSNEMTEGYMEYLNNHCNDRFPLFNSDRCTVTALDWHSLWQNKGLVVNNEGIVSEISVWDKTPLSWSSSSSLMYSRSEEPTNDVLHFHRDISIVMKERVSKGYGFNISKNIEVTNDDQTLCSVWNWLNKQISSSSDSKRSLQGVSDILENISDSTQSIPISSNCPLYPLYTSHKRANALDLCGWNFFNHNELLDGFLKSQELSGKYERAAAIAVFQGNLPRANSSLRFGANDAMKNNDKLRGSLFNLIALSLSGYSPNEPSLWQETCLLIKTQINNSYLRALFSFLSAGSCNDNFEDILSDSSLLLQDRVAFACMYLDDVQLKKTLEVLKKKVVSDGLIEGVFLTGLSNDGISLLANYVNKTGDVQTACFIAGLILPTRNVVVHTWFEGYRDLLDQWRLWKERAQFDHNRKILDTSHKPLRNTSVLCTFCSKAISSDILRQDRLKGSAKKSTSCPSCRKPLPRCALCLLHMVAGSSKGKDHSIMSQLDQFGQWFTWCQTCRHGGHAIHMTEWFETHKVCPVTDCNCHCLSLDSAAK